MLSGLSLLKFERISTPQINLRNKPSAIKSLDVNPMWFTNYYELMNMCLTFVD
jgi:hypothetical protein